MIEKKKLTPLILAGIFILMLGLSYAAVPLYDLFCRVTGFGGTTQIANNPPKKFKGSCLDGRDITYNIIPDADLKFYITASLKDRANRRFKELMLINPKIDKKLVIKELQKRDQRDMERSTAPLKIADDAIIVDTSDLTIEEVMIKVQREIEEIIK